MHHCLLYTPDNTQHIGNIFLKRTNNDDNQKCFFMPYISVHLEIPLKIPIHQTPFALTAYTYAMHLCLLAFKRDIENLSSELIIKKKLFCNLHNSNVINPHQNPKKKQQRALNNGVPYIQKRKPYKSFCISCVGRYMHFFYGLWRPIDFFCPPHIHVHFYSDVVLFIVVIF